MASFDDTTLVCPITIPQQTVTTVPLSPKPTTACTFPGCKKTFTLRSNMRRHLFTHTTKPQHKCTVCPSAFHRRADLTTHMRVHTGEKPMPCSVCGRRFARGSDLRSHERTHMGVKRWKCECGKGFSRRFDLRKHKSKCELVIAATSAAAVAVKQFGSGMTLIPTSISFPKFFNNSGICGDISDDGDSTDGNGTGGGVAVGVTNLVVSGSDSDGEGSNERASEEERRAGEALLGLMQE